MKQPDASHLLDLLAAMSHQTSFALGCYCEDENHCHRSVLRELLAQRAPPSTEGCAAWDRRICVAGFVSRDLLRLLSKWQTITGLQLRPSSTVDRRHMSPALPERLPPSEPAAQVAAAVAAPVPWWQRPLKPFHSRFARYLAIGSVLLGGIAAGGHFIGGMIGWWHLYEVTFHAGKPTLQASTTDAKSRKLPRLSIVVLPLTIEGGAQDSDWLTDNLSGDLTNQLGRLSGSMVISRDTAFTYKGKAVDPREVSRELGVRYVVRGTVRRDGDRVRLNLSMVDGESGAQQWAQQFDLERAGLTRSLDDIGLRVARSLSVQLERSEGKRVAAMQAEEVQADDLAMQGWEVWYHGYSRENLVQANRLFESAVARDPGSIRGWAGVWTTTGFARVTDWLPDREAVIRRMQFAASRLQTLDGDDYYAHMSRINVAAGDGESVLALADTIIERFPSSPWGYFHRGFALMQLGRFEECPAPVRQAIRLGPRDSMLGTWKWLMGVCYFKEGDYARSIEYARGGVRANANSPGFPPVLAASLAREGQAEEARQVMADFLQRNPGANSEIILRGLPGKSARFVEARTHYLATLRELGLPSP